MRQTRSMPVCSCSIATRSHTGYHVSNLFRKTWTLATNGKRWMFTNTPASFQLHATVLTGRHFQRWKEIVHILGRQISTVAVARLAKQTPHEVKTNKKVAVTAVSAASLWHEVCFCRQVLTWISTTAIIPLHVSMSEFVIFQVLSNQICEQSLWTERACSEWL